MWVQKQVVDALMKPEAYDEEPGQIELTQTHISFVFLTRNFVYKVKKAVDFRFLDFTTLEKRRFFCEIELELNRRLCGDMYLEVVPINRSEIIKMKGEGETIEYAVKMKRNLSFFEKRVAEDRVRDCHGDIHSGNIFITDQIYIFDAIEFNERFRYSDVASDVAFLAMDLDFKKRTDLSNYFIERYVKYSGDQELTKLLPFYKCYRAYVRGKVTSFKLKDPNVSSEEKEAATKEASTYFKLATTYAETLIR